MTTPQRNFIQILLRDRDTTALGEAEVRRAADMVANGDYTTRAASEMIGALTACPFKPREPRTLDARVAPESTVAAGRYAVQLADDDQLRFYKVDTPTEGRWAGRTFVNMYASDDRYPVRGARATQVLAAIAADPQAAMLRYGQEIGACGHCGRKLTDEASRARGIGPVCAGRMEWAA